MWRPRKAQRRSVRQDGNAFRRRCARTRSAEPLETRELLAADLVAQWRADDLLATVADGGAVSAWTDSIGQRAATAVGTPRLINGGLGGRAAIQFDAADGADTLTVPKANNPLNGAQDFAIVVVFQAPGTGLTGGSAEWFKNTGLVDANEQAFSRDYGVSINATGQLAGGLGNGFGSNPLTSTVYSTQSVADNQLHTVIFARRGTNLSWLIDGAAGGQATSTNAAVRASVALAMGGLATGTGGAFTGLISEVRLYSGAMDDAQQSAVTTALRDQYSNRLPTATADTYSIAEDHSATVSAVDGVLKNDVDADGDALHTALVANVEHGTLVWNADGSFQYTPATDFAGDDGFTYQAIDSNGANSVPVHVTIHVTAVNDAPVGASDLYFTTVNQTLTIGSLLGVLANDHDVDSAQLTSSLTRSVQHGSLTMQSDGSFQYRPATGYVGTDSFVYQVSDGIDVAKDIEVTLVTNSVLQQRRVMISELHVNPDVDNEPVEFIEVYNDNDLPIGLSGWYFSDGIAFLFPVGAYLPAHGYGVVSQDPTALSKKYQVTSWGPWSGGLANEGEIVALTSSAGDLIDFVEYGLGFPWPTTGDAPGRSLQLINLAGDNSVAGMWRSAVPTPGAANAAVAVTNPAPLVTSVTHSPEQPKANEIVTIAASVADGNGVASVLLSYQLVDPGHYVRLTDPEYQTSWTSLPMHDDGKNGDAVAGDGTYSAQLPAELQIHRRLVRYRVEATDNLAAIVNVPYADDPSPNFAYFVYNGVPDWTGSKRPDTLPAVTYSSETLTTLPTYHLIANQTDVNNSQYNSQFNLKLFNATVVYDGLVYDHISFRNRGRASTYQVGKNKWKLNFTRGHSFQARDNYGNRYAVDWDKINVLPGTNPWWRNDVSTEGTVLYEPVAFRLYELAGTPASHTQYFQFRVIDAEAEASATSQYEGDFWGLYIAIEQPDGRYLSERGMNDGNLFNMHGGATSSTVRNQGSQSVSDLSDLRAFISAIAKSTTPEEWYRQNLDLEDYFGWNAINLAVNNSDLRPNENVNYYRDQVTGLLSTLPWDLDLTFEDRPHLSRPDSQWETIQNMFKRYPALLQLFQNRVREIEDLLFDNGDAQRVVDEFAGFLLKGDATNNVVEANQAMWDYHPRKAKKGIWYKNFTPDLMTEQTFNGLQQYMKTFLGAGGYGRDRMVAKANDPDIPTTPTIHSLGAGVFDVANLPFQADAFADPQGSATFAGIEWRVAEVNVPGATGFSAQRPHLYEIEGTRWRSDLLTEDSTAAVQIPGSRLEVGKTYRVRARVLDDSGKFSHWSAPIEFVATAGGSRALQDLRVSEVHYHPASPSPQEIAAGFVVGDDFEFIELQNVGTQPLSLAGVSLKQVVINAQSEGVAFNFLDSPLTELAPNATLVVVEDVDAFRQRYGDTIPVAGQWVGQLSNGSETVTLSVFDQIIQQFEYDDAWYPTTDGVGASLEVVNTRSSDLASWTRSSGWRASAETGGNPGNPQAVRTVGDSNHDGIFDSEDLVEVFQRGEYEDGVALNSVWEDGDWNGDQEFSTEDLVFAFQVGSYVAAAKRVL